MSAQLLALFKVSLLVLLYLFLFRVVRAVWAELQSPQQGLVNSVDPAGPPPPVPSRRPLGVPVAEPPTGASAVVPPRHLQPASTLTQLVVVAPESLAGRTFSLGAGEVTIGRSSACTIALDDAFVSTHHARVFADPAGGWAVEDTGSTNGTWINGQRLAGTHHVRSGDRLGVGGVVAEFR